MLLSLPVIAPEVPSIIDIGAIGERHLRLALSMSQFGMTSDADLAGLRRTKITKNVLTRLIGDGWRRSVGQEFTFKTISAYVELVLPDRSDEEFFTSGDGVPQVGMMLSASQPEWIIVGRALEAIEATHPGLGRAALRILESTLCHFGMPHTPGGALELCQHLYWFGEEDESVAMEEEGEDADIPRRDVLFDGVPQWAYCGYSDEVVNMDSETFSACVERFADRPFGNFLASVLRLRDLERGNHDLFFPCFEEASTNLPPIVFGWRDDTDFVRIFDDNHRYCAEGEEAPWAGMLRFDVSPKGISEAMVSIRHTGSVLRALDEALTELKVLNDV